MPTLHDEKDSEDPRQGTPATLSARFGSIEHLGSGTMTDTLDLTLAQINAKMIGAAESVRLSLDEYRRTNAAWVESERDYRHAKAIGRLKLKAKLVSDREDELFLMIEKEWLEAEQAKALRDTAKEALRASMAILSGMQSVASAHREEARLANWEPREVSA